MLLSSCQFLFSIVSLLLSRTRPGSASRQGAITARRLKLCAVIFENKQNAWSAALTPIWSVSSVMHTKFIASLSLPLSLVMLLSVARARPADHEADLIESFRTVEAASVADAMEQLYGKKAYMSHDMRPVMQTKFAGPATTVLLKQEEHKDGAKAQQGMLDAIDEAPAGSVYVMVLENGLNYAGIGGLMSTAMKYRGLAGAVVDGGVRDTPQVSKLQFPVFSRSVVPSTTVNHFRFVGKDIPVKCAGVEVRPRDIIVADMDGVVVVPREKAEEVLKKAQALDQSEHSMYPFIEQFRSIREAVAKFGRL
jgi:4-hydroxy-4-methyl-2-oxoglutarate aldolase